SAASLHIDAAAGVSLDDDCADLRRADVYTVDVHPETHSSTLSLHDALPISPSPTKSSNLSETAEVPACNVPSRSPLPALAIAPETKLGTASSGLGTLEP